MSSKTTNPRKKHLLANYYAERLAMYAALPDDVARWELFLSEVRAKYEHPDTALEVLYAQHRLGQARGLTPIATSV
jgi:hypothetical protein